MDLKWYVVYTKTGLENKVSEFLTKRKIENYNPCINEYESWDDTKKAKKTVLFKGYVFVKTTEQMHEQLKNFPGVINFVYWMGRPVCIKNFEIKTIKLFLSEYSKVSLEKVAIKNDAITPAKNEDTEQEAPMITIKNKKANILLPSLGYVLHAEVETQNVRIISTENLRNKESLKSTSLFSRVFEFNNSLKNYWVKP